MKRARIKLFDSPKSVILEGADGGTTKASVREMEWLSEGLERGNTPLEKVQTRTMETGLKFIRENFVIISGDGRTPESK